MLIISSSEFRDNQKSYFDKVDEGVEILIQRSKNKSYRLVPIREDDMLISKEELLAKINISLQQIKDGKFTALETKQDITNFLASL